MPGGPRTGAPGKHVIKGKAKYRLVDEQVRYFVAPAIEDIQNSPVCQPRGVRRDYTHICIAPAVREHVCASNSCAEERRIWKVAQGRSYWRILL